LRFFPIGFDLAIESLDWLDQIASGSLVMMIDYFGFPCDATVVKKVQARGAFVVEDASQALLSLHVGLVSDFVLYSPRKMVGVPDGGILQYRRSYRPPHASLNSPPANWWLSALEACVARREFDKYGGERYWFEIFREAEATYPLGPFEMSELSVLLLRTAFDYSFIAQVRRANYQLLADRLSEIALFGTLDEETIPLGFPVVVHNRDAIREVLFTNEIFPPVHWMISECVPSDFLAAHKLSSQIMTLPCDQRLAEKDIHRIVNALLTAMDGV